MTVKYGMVIDLEACIACDACTMACRQAKATVPGVLFAKVLKYEIGKYPQARLGYLPVLCNNCDKPPCVDVCPADAARKLENGIVAIDQEKCIGCQACVLACPYGARNGFKTAEPYFLGFSTPFEEKKTEEHPVGKVEKCDFCLDRVVKGRQPACVEACPTEARVFGDLTDPSSAVGRLCAGGNTFSLRPDLKTDPNVYYLPSRAVK